MGEFNVVYAQIIDFTVHAVVVVDSFASTDIEPLVNGTDLGGAVGLSSFEDTIYVNFLRTHVVGADHVLPSTGCSRTGPTARAV